MTRVGLVSCFLAKAQEINQINQRGPMLESYEYVCGGCRKNAHGRVVAKAPYEGDNNIKGEIFWCLCPCGQPTVVSFQVAPTVNIQQHPIAKLYFADAKWPSDLAQLFNEAASALSAGANTAAAMVCRKILMAVACKEGDTDGKGFAEYVDFIVTNVVPIATAKAAIDRIRQIGNEANHNITFVSEPDARRAIEIARYVLNAAYALPAA
jgi:hypothetical protein